MKTITKEIIPVLIMMLLILSSCSPAPDLYDFETAIRNGDVVNVHGQTYNIEQLDAFLANVKSGHKAEVQITEYTNEGDPILQILQYDGQVIRYTYDNSRDKFAGSDKGKKQSEMIDILKEEKEDTVIWYLVDAQGNKNVIFSMQKTESTEVSSDKISELHNDIIHDLMQHPELIPYEGVLGGTMGFYDPESIQVLSDRWVFAGFDDGHINGYMLLSYRINDGKISWEVIDSYLDGRLPPAQETYDPETALNPKDKQPASQQISSAIPPDIYLFQQYPSGYEFIKTVSGLRGEVEITNAGAAALNLTNRLTRNRKDL